MGRYDGGKKIKGDKRHAMVDTDGRALKLRVHAADVQDRDGAGPLLRASHPRWPFVEVAFADAGYQGPRVAAANPIRVGIVRMPEAQVGFTVHPKRWVVERSLAGINRNARLAKDVEATLASAEAFLYVASVILLLQGLARERLDSRRTFRLFRRLLEDAKFALATADAGRKAEHTACERL